MSPALLRPDRVEPLTRYADRRLPNALVSAAGFLVTLTAAAALASLRRHLSSGDDLAVMAVVVGLLGWWSRWRAALVCGGLGWLMLNGFVTDRYGVLRWHGPSDATRLAALLGCAVVAAALHGLCVRGRWTWRQRARGAGAHEPGDGWIAAVHAIRGGHGA